MIYVAQTCIVLFYFGRNIDIVNERKVQGAKVFRKRMRGKTVLQTQMVRFKLCSETEVLKQAAFRVTGELETRQDNLDVSDRRW
jgi:hypothetical protein